MSQSNAWAGGTSIIPVPEFQIGSKMRQKKAQAEAKAGQDIIAATKDRSWFGFSSQEKAERHNQQLRSTNQGCSLLMPCLMQTLSTS